MNDFKSGAALGHSPPLISYQTGISAGTGKITAYCGIISIVSFSYHQIN